MRRFLLQHELKQGTKGNSGTVMLAHACSLERILALRKLRWEGTWIQVQPRLYIEFSASLGFRAKFYLKKPNQSLEAHNRLIWPKRLRLLVSWSNTQTQNQSLIYKSWHFHGVNAPNIVDFKWHSNSVEHMNKCLLPPFFKSLFFLICT